MLTAASVMFAAFTVACTQGGAPPESTSRATQSPRSGDPVLRREFVFDTLPVPSVHASTIVEVPGGVAAAWFGGSHEGAADVGIWLSRLERGRWSTPVEVARGHAPDGAPAPCWNPVLFHAPDGRLRLYYKVGPSPARWWGMTQSSPDDGRSWSPAERLPDGLLGPIKNKPVTLNDGTIISGSSTESPDAAPVWRVHFERSLDRGRSWSAVTPPGQEFNAIQPSVLIHRDGRLQAVGRTNAGRIFETWSTDRGAHWSPLLLTSLPNPNSGLDATTLRDGRFLLVYNHTSSGRTPLNVALSKDGVAWSAALVLEQEPGEFSYPAVIQTSDGLVHVVYTWNRRRIRHVVIDPARLHPVQMVAGEWTASVH